MVTESAAPAWLSRARRVVLLFAFGGFALHAHELNLYIELAEPKGFLPPPLLWSCAPYVLALVLSATRHQWVAAAIAVCALVPDLIAHYEVYVRPYIPRRFDARGFPVYAAPALSLFVVAPVIALIAWILARRRARRRAR